LVRGRHFQRDLVLVLAAATAAEVMEDTEEGMGVLRVLLVPLALLVIVATANKYF
jgi:hypothetical protein